MPIVTSSYIVCFLLLICCSHACTSCYNYCGFADLMKVERLTWEGHVYVHRVCGSTCSITYVNYKKPMIFQGSILYSIESKDNWSFFKMFLLKYKLIYSVVFISGTQQSDSIIHMLCLFFCIFFSIMVYHKIVNIIIHAIQ